MKETSGNYPGIRVNGNKEIEYYIHKAHVIRAVYINEMLQRIGTRIASLFKDNKRTPAGQAGKPLHT